MPTARTPPPGYVPGSSLAALTNTSRKHDDNDSSLEDDEDDDDRHYHNFQPAESECESEDEDDNYDISMPLCLPTLPPTIAARSNTAAASSASLCNTTGHKSKRKDAQPLPYRLLTACRSKKKRKKSMLQTWTS